MPTAQVPCPSPKPTWDETAFALLDVIAERSDDPRTKVGCVIMDSDHNVVSLGYNGAPRGVPNERVSEAGDEKYDWVVHADENAILNAGRHGKALIGCTMYLPWCPCSACARSIVQSGITEVVLRSDKVQTRWLSPCGKALRMMIEAGVKVRKPYFGGDDGMPINTLRVYDHEQ